MNRRNVDVCDRNQGHGRGILGVLCWYPSIKIRIAILRAKMWATRRRRAMAFIEAIPEILTTHRWSGRGSTIAILELELINKHGVTHGRITEDIGIHGDPGDSLVLELNMALTVDGEKLPPIPVLVIPKHSVELVQNTAFQFKREVRHV